MDNICRLYMSTTSKLYVHYTYTLRTLYAHYMCTICTLYVHHMHTTCIHNCTHAKRGPKRFSPLCNYGFMIPQPQDSSRFLKIPQDSSRFPFRTSTRAAREARAPAPPLVFCFLFSPSPSQGPDPRAFHLPRDQKRSARRWE